MKHLKRYKLFESTLSKSHLVDRIKWYSNYLHQYMKDVNKYTTSNLNFGFSYSKLEIRQIFEAAEKLNHNSADGFITSVCNEFITWSDHMIKSHGRIGEELIDYRIDKGYENFTDEYKEEHRHELYGRQQTYWMVYAAVGRDIKNSISGTIWDIPQKKKFNEEDRLFILDSLESDYDTIPLTSAYADADYINKCDEYIKSTEQCNNAGVSVVIRLPVMSGVKMDYDSEFINRLQSYFSGVLILNGSNYSDYRLYLPFYQW